MGSQVYVSGIDIQTRRPSRKLEHRRYGPFTIKRKVGTHNYELELTQQFKCLHPIFHGNKLVPHISDPNPFHIPPPPPPVQLEGTDEWEINQILDSKHVGRGVKYLIDWKGYGPEERT